jgi:hypothetical protein
MNTLTIVFVIIIIALTIAAIKTVIPNAKASKPCLLGYRAACSFTPVSTIILIVADIAILVIAKKFVIG